MKKAEIVIVGRQNVGKSTLFNKLIGRRLAIVNNEPGITRDFNKHEVEWCGKYYDFIDTGGLFGYDKKSGIMITIEKQTKELFKKSKLIIFLVDGKEGLLVGDEYIASLIRKFSKKVLVVVNKLDKVEKFSISSVFFSLGFGDPIPISAAQGLGIGDMLDIVSEKVNSETAVVSIKDISISIAGRPNVGKSSLLNSILGKERSVVHFKPGTTRDPVVDSYKYKGFNFKFIDTAGYRRFAKIEDSIEFYSIRRAWSVYRQSLVTIVVIDASLGIVRGDWRVLNEVSETSGSIILCLNKIDLVESELINDLLKKIKQKLGSRDHIPIVSISALYKKRISKLLDKVVEVYSKGIEDIDKFEFNDFLKNLTKVYHPPLRVKKRVRLKAFYLVHKQPHLIIIKANIPNALSETYMQFLKRKIRDKYNLDGIMIKIRIEEE